MTPEDQRIAIAEACGYTNIHRDKLGFLVADLKGHHFGIPDYLNDLNAMHEAEKVLSSEQVENYQKILGNTCNRPWHATASQRREAFLRAIGQWPE